MTILIIFQFSGYKNFKIFYLGKFHNAWLKCFFPSLPSYSRFIEIMRRVGIYFIIFNAVYSGKKSGIYYIDSSKLPVCSIKRAKRHKVFSGLSEFGKTSMGWFFGLKIHLVINNLGEIIAFKLSSGNMHDVTLADVLCENLHGLIFGDKGYIGQKIFEKLFAHGLKLITEVRKNMKHKELFAEEKQLLKGRSKIETIIGYLKNNFMIWHTRHRSVVNAVTHLLAAITAYALQPIKFHTNIEKNLVKVC